MKDEFNKIVGLSKYKVNSDYATGQLPGASENSSTSS